MPCNDGTYEQLVRPGKRSDMTYCRPCVKQRDRGAAQRYTVVEVVLSPGELEPWLPEEVTGAGGSSKAGKVFAAMRDAFVERKAEQSAELRALVNVPKLGNGSDRLHMRRAPGRARGQCGGGRRGRRQRRRRRQRHADPTIDQGWSAEREAAHRRWQAACAAPAHVPEAS